MKRLFTVASSTAVLMAAAVLPSLAGPGPFDGTTFKGRIAYSADGNFNDPDDWAASPMVLAILAEAGVKDRLVHFDYNCILPRNDPDWERTHAESVLGAAERYGYDQSVFHDCRKDLDAALASIARAIDESSAENPLHFILAGPMEVPFRGIERSVPEKRKFVYCISHSWWNDGFSSAARHDFFTFNKRSVIASGVNWVQIAGQNPLLRPNPYSRPATEKEWGQYHWMRDSGDPKVRFLWERMQVSMHPDPSDAGMAYFLVTGDEQADPVKLKRLLDDKGVPTPVAERSRVRLEAEDFRHLEACEHEFRKNLRASQNLYVKLSEGNESGRIRTRFNQPYAANHGWYDVEVRYFVEPGQRCRLALAVEGTRRGAVLDATGTGQGWATRAIPGVEIHTGDELSVEISGPALVDYVQLNRVAGAQAKQKPKAARAAPEQEHPRFRATGPLDDPNALPGQVIVAGANPGYLKHNGGKPVFLCGPDNPETFLFLGKLNEDGTRSGGEQEAIIRRLAESGVNAFHFQMTRLRRCNIKDEGDDQHCPFIDFDPSKPLNQAVINQWDGWISQLEAAGVIVHLEFYNDATDVERMGWTLDEDGNLHPDERRFFEGIVNRFEHHKNIIWGIEESLNKLPRGWTPHFMKLSELIARTDDHNHPIVHSFVTPETAERDLHPDAVMSEDYRGDPHIDIVTWLHVPPRGEDYESQHKAYLEYARHDNDRFIPMKNETEYHRINRATARRQTWASALAGMHALEAQHDASPRRNRGDWLADDGKVVAFMEQTDFYRMESHDELASGSTKWVLARPGESYIAYTWDYSGSMGVRNLPAGAYNLLWFDTISGEQVAQTDRAVSAGETKWSKPESIGDEVALYIKRRRGPNR